ncbi:MAG: DUF1508 domain-containing protein [Anaeroplasmataceae bacterium]
MSNNVLALSFWNLTETNSYLVLAIGILIVLLAIILLIVSIKSKMSKNNLKEGSDIENNSKPAKLTKEEKMAEKQKEQEAIYALKEEKRAQKQKEQEDILALKEEKKAQKEKEVQNQSVVKEEVKKVVTVKEEVKAEKKEVIKEIKSVESTVKSTTTSKPVVKEENSAEPKQAKYAGKYIIFPDTEFFRYKLKASNGEILVTSEPYKTKTSAKKGIENLQNSLNDALIDVNEDKHGLFRFRLTTKMGRILVQSANYDTKQKAKSASESFRKFVLTDVIEMDEDHKEVHLAVEREKIVININPEIQGKFIIDKDDDGFKYVLKANNGVILCQSKIYKSAASCKAGLSIFKDAVYTGDFYIAKDKNKKFQFKLYSVQNRLVADGEVYSNRQACYNVIESIKRFTKLAELE